MARVESISLREDVIEAVGGTQTVVPLLDWIMGYASPHDCSQLMSSGLFGDIANNRSKCSNIEIPYDLVKQLKHFSGDSSLEEAATALLLVARIMGGIE